MNQLDDRATAAPKPASRCWSVALAALLTAAAGCGAPSATTPSGARYHIDALLNARFDAQSTLTLPGYKRWEELYPNHGGTPASAGATHRQRLQRLRENSNADALLAAGSKAATPLTELLGDTKRQDLAAIFLGEIGGPVAATALLEAWRRTRAASQTRTSYTKEAVTHLSGQTVTGALVYERPPFQSAVVYSLSLCGRPVAEQIAQDTLEAINAAEALQRQGEPIRFEESGDLDGLPAQVSWLAEPADTAVEGIGVLSMVGGEHAVRVLATSLRSPVQPIRWDAIQASASLAYEAEPLLPQLVEALADPAFRKEARSALSLLYHTSELRRVEDPSEMEWKQIAAHWTERIAQERIPRELPQATPARGGG